MVKLRIRFGILGGIREFEFVGSTSDAAAILDKLKEDKDATSGAVAESLCELKWLT